MSPEVCVDNGCEKIRFSDCSAASFCVSVYEVEAYFHTNMPILVAIDFISDYAKTSWKVLLVTILCADYERAYGYESACGYECVCGYKCAYGYESARGLSGREILQCALVTKLNHLDA